MNRKKVKVIVISCKYSALLAITPKVAARRSKQMRSLGFEDKDLTQKSKKVKKYKILLMEMKVK